MSVSDYISLGLFLGLRGDKKAPFGSRRFPQNPSGDHGWLQSAIFQAKGKLLGSEQATGLLILTWLGLGLGLGSARSGSAWLGSGFYGAQLKAFLWPNVGKPLCSQMC